MSTPSALVAARRELYADLDRVVRTLAEVRQRDPEKARRLAFAESARLGTLAELSNLYPNGALTEAEIYHHGQEMMGFYETLRSINSQYGPW